MPRLTWVKRGAINAIFPLGIVISQNPLDNANGRPTPPTLGIVDRVKHVRPIQVDDFIFLRKHAGNALPKVCIPSPTMAHFRGGRAAISKTVYPDVSQISLHIMTTMSEKRT